MWREIANRLMQGLLVLFVLGTLTFFLVHALPYGPFQDEKAIPDNVRERLEQIHGYDKPLLTQYWLRLNNIVRGDLGTSIKVMEGREVSDILLQAFPVSLTLGLFAMAIAISIGIPAGVLAAIRKNRAPDYIIMAVALLGICLPNFVIGPLLAEFFGGRLGWFPVSGWDPRSPSAMFLPALTLGLVSAAYLSRLTRAGMLEILHQDFIRTARAKGQKGHIIIIRHALRGGLIPSIAFLGPAFAGTISGSVVVESIFQIPGIGRLFIKAIETGDETLIMGPVLLYGTLIVTANFLVDLIQLWLNPRLRARAAA
ncbi:MAG: ABC transporter permease [Akkermansiaceae bacterium]|jgi:oligopeptide transport system permease protein|nr:ABC transporter permease [Akkermansiaceae bacterium]